MCPAEVTVEKKDAETGKSIPTEQTQYKVKSLDLNRYVSDGMKKKDGKCMKQIETAGS